MVIIEGLYDALKAANMPDDKARAAARSGAACDAKVVS
jgi:hypothetical protein